MTETPRAIELVDFVLLACQFSVIGPREDHADDSSHDAESATSTSESGGIDVDGARHHIVSLEIDDDESEFVFVLETVVDNPDQPYEISVITGSRFTIPDPPVTTNDAASTLLFITYPYVRELIFALTSRSPFAGFRLPPLTKRPAWGAAANDG